MLPLGAAGSRKRDGADEARVPGRIRIKVQELLFVCAHQLVIYLYMRWMDEGKGRGHDGKRKGEMQGEAGIYLLLRGRATAGR